ncbi:MAG: tetratricopeptide repeat protein [Vampirovibrionales bacterium]
MPVWADVPELLGEAANAWQTGNIKQACQAYHEAQALSPTHPQVLYGVSLCYQQSNVGKAVATLTQLVGLYPNYGPAWLLLGELYEQQGRQADAIEAYRRYVSLGEPLPKSPSLRLRLRQWGLI